MAYKKVVLGGLVEPSFGTNLVYRTIIRRIDNFAFPKWSGILEDDALVMNAVIQNLTRITNPCRRLAEKNSGLKLPSMFDAGTKLGARFAEWFNACPLGDRLRFGELDSLGRLRGPTTKIDKNWFESYIANQSPYKMASIFCDYFGGLRLVFKTSNGGKVAVWTS